MCCPLHNSWFYWKRLPCFYLQCCAKNNQTTGQKAKEINLGLTDKMAALCNDCTKIEIGILLDWGLANIGSHSCENNSCKFLGVICGRIILANLGKQDEEHSGNINEDQNPQKERLQN